MQTKITIPATSANLGAGFDIIGLSIDELTDTLEVFWGEDADLAEPLQVIGSGLFAELGDKANRSTKNLVYRLIREELEGLGVRKNLPFSIICHNFIAHSRGLGSSSAAIVSSMRAAYRIAESQLGHKPTLNGQECDENQYAFIRGCEIEGHPDNVAPCVFGGIQMSYGDGVSLASIKPANDLNIAVQVFRDSRLKTKDARAVIPYKILHNNAIKNTRNFGCLLLGLQTGSNDLLLKAEDYLHQEYRRKLYPKSMELVDLGRKNGIPTFISGAGTSVISMWFGDLNTFNTRFREIFSNAKLADHYHSIYIVD